MNEMGCGTREILEVRSDLLIMSFAVLILFIVFWWFKVVDRDGREELASVFAFA